MSEPRYVRIYCAKKARSDMRHRARPATGHHDPVGAAYAQKVKGQWQCCCCKRRVRVAW